MNDLERLTVDDPRNDWAKFYTFQGIVVANMLDDRAIKAIDQQYVITVQTDEDTERFPPHLVCADDKPVFRIRTFESFATARRFMSSLVLRGVNAKMRIAKVDRENGANF